MISFFDIRENKLFHKKIDSVLESKLSKRKDGAARIKKYRKNNGKDECNEDVTRYTSVSNAPRGEERRLEEVKDIGKPISKKRGTRIADNWLADETDINYAFKKDYDNDQINELADRFKDHWIQATGKGSTSLDWHAKWRTWISNDIKWHGKPATRSRSANLSPHESLHNAAALAVSILDGQPQDD